MNILDNPIADIIRDYNIIYDGYVSKLSMNEDSVDSNIKLFDGCFADIVEDEEVIRVNGIFDSANALLDELASLLDTCKSMFKDFEELNDIYNELIVETTDVSEISDEYMDLSVYLKDTLDKINAIFDALDKYMPVIDQTMDTLETKYADEYNAYVEKMKNKGKEDTLPVEESKIVKEANKIFDAINDNKPEAMFDDNRINMAFSLAAQTPKVITEQEFDAYTEAVNALQDLKQKVYDRFKGLYAKYAGADILTEHNASVNNILEECDNLLRIFSCAVDNPSDWAAVQSAQSAAYRYEALQNDITVIMDSLDIVEQKLNDGAARTIGSRNVPTSLDESKLSEYNELYALVGDLENEINEYFDKISCDENMRAWIVNRFNDILYHAENYENALNDISATTSVAGGNWPLAIYGQEGVYGSILGNELRECNLAATEIRNIIRNQRKRY